MSERYPSRWLLWYGYPKLSGEAERALKPWPVMGTGEPARTANLCITEDVARSLAPSSCCVGVLVPDEVDEDDTESASEAPSVLGAGSCCDGGALVCGELVPFPAPDVN